MRLVKVDLDLYRSRRSIRITYHKPMTPRLQLSETSGVETIAWAQPRAREHGGLARPGLVPLPRATTCAAAKDSAWIPKQSLPRMPARKEAPGADEVRWPGRALQSWIAPPIPPPAGRNTPCCRPHSPSISSHRAPDH